MMNDEQKTKSIVKERRREVFLVLYPKTLGLPLEAFPQKFWVKWCQSHRVTRRHIESLTRCHSLQSVQRSTGTLAPFSSFDTMTSAYPSYAAASTSKRPPIPARTLSTDTIARTKILMVGLRRCARNDANDNNTHYFAQEWKDFYSASLVQQLTPETDFLP